MGLKNLHGDRAWKQQALRLWVLAIAFSCGVAQAAPIPFNNVEVYYELEEEPLANFLQSLFASQGLRVELSPSVVQRSTALNGPRSGTPKSIFDSVARSNQLISYYDGSTVYIYQAAERVTRYLSLPPNRINSFVKTFNDLRLGDQANVINASPANGLVSITGTWRFVEQVEQLGSAMQQQLNSDPKVFRYFPLRYALAGDSKMTVGNRSVTVPGVASVLQLASGSVTGAGSAETKTMRPAARRLGGTGLNAIGDDASMRPVNYPPVVPNEQATNQAQFSAPLTTSTSFDPAAPQIIADPHRNAIIVRDSPDRMPLYEDLIALLDTEPMMVEIEATIIDVDRQRLRRLGVDWRVKRGQREFFFGSDGGINRDLVDDNGNVRDEFVDAINNDDVDFIGALSGLNISSVIGNSTRIASRINLLADADVVSVVSRPQVLTLNDTEAVIESSSEVYVPVGGTYEVDLFQVIAGTLLRVTPHVVVEPDGRQRIRLSISIEDGNVGISPDFVDEGLPVPLVSRNALNTQALLEENQSLLLGGLVTERASYGERGVPGLMKVPVLKRIFSRESKSESQRERLFLITPRLVASNQITGQLRPSDPATGAGEYLQDLY